MGKGSALPGCEHRAAFMLAGAFARVGDIGPALPAGYHGDGFRLRLGLGRRTAFPDPALRLSLGVEAAEKLEAVPDRSDDQAKDKQL